MAPIDDQRQPPWLPTDDDQPLNRDEAARLVRLSTRHLDRLRLRGEGPRHIRFGMRVLYRRADLKDWMASRVVDSG